MRKELKNVRAAVFDLDGTLFDSVGLWHEIDEIFLNRRGLVPTDEYKKSIAALGFKGAADLTIQYYGLADRPEALIAEWDALARDAYAHTVKLFDGVREYLAECKAAGITIAAVTSLHREFAEQCMKNNGIYGYFSQIFNADETGYAKSSPDIYIHAAKTLGVPCAACVMFDDVAVAIVAAKSAGMTTVAVQSVMTDISACRSSAGFVISSLAQAPKLIK